MNSSKMQYKTCDYHPPMQSTVVFVNYFLTIYWCGIKNLPLAITQTAAKNPGESISGVSALRKKLCFFQITGRSFALFGNQIVADFVILVQETHSGLLNSGNMDKHVLSAGIGSNKSIAFAAVKPFYCSC